MPRDSVACDLLINIICKVGVVRLASIVEEADLICVPSRDQLEPVYLSEAANSIYKTFGREIF